MIDLDSSGPGVITRIFAPLAVLAGGVVVWWTATAAGVVEPFVVPPPPAVARELVGSPGLYLSQARHTLVRVLVGGSVGAGAGLLAGVVLAQHRWLRQGLVPYLVAARVTPKIAAAPLLLVYLGTGPTTGLVFVVLVAFFPATVGTLAGFERPPDRALDLARSVSAGRLQTLRRVQWPYARPDVAAGVKQSLALSFVGAVVAEWIVGEPGLGYLSLVATERVQPAVLVASLLMLFAVALIVYGVVAAVLDHATWRP